MVKKSKQSVFLLPWWFTGQCGGCLNATTTRIKKLKQSGLFVTLVIHWTMRWMFKCHNYQDKINMEEVQRVFAKSCLPLFSLKTCVCAYNASVHSLTVCWWNVGSNTGWHLKWYDDDKMGLLHEACRQDTIRWTKKSTGSV